MIHSDKLMELAECIEYSKLFCKENGYSLKAVQMSDRSENRYRTRQAVARHLRGLGYSYPIIGMALKRHHTTIMMMCKDEMKEKRKEKGKAL